VNKERVAILVRDGKLRPRQPDFALAKSLIASARNDASVALAIKLEEKSATVIFRTIYEAIRQLGEARWIMLGYQPDNHETSLEALLDLDIKDKVKLNYLDRFRRIRNDANYRGFTVSESQAREMLGFWKACSSEIIEKISNEA